MSLDTIRKLKDDMEAMRARLNEEFKVSISSLFKEFFEANPEVYCFVWSQYTPYFNDGEECVFGVNEIFAYHDTDVVREALKEGERSIFWGEVEADNAVVETSDSKYVRDPKTGNYVKERVELSPYQINTSEFISALSEFSDEFKYAFGDHVCVVVTRDGIDVNEFDHD